MTHHQLNIFCSKRKSHRMSQLTVELLHDEAIAFAETESTHDEPSLYGKDNGKTIGTYLEHKFQAHLHERYTYEEGSSASGMDLPGLNIDIKTTSITRPQSSCPYKDAKQKIYGLGYGLLVFVYDKTDDPSSNTAQLNIKHTVLIRSHRTGDYQTTSRLDKIIQNNGNKDDVLALFEDRSLPGDEITHDQLAEEVLTDTPPVGYLTISNALQWRLAYTRAIRKAGEVEGIYDA